MIARFRAWMATLAVLALLAPGWAQAAAQVTGLQLVSSVRVDRVNVDYTYKIAVSNGTPALNAATATVRSTAAATQIIKGTVALGNLGVGAAITSTDTFTLRQDRTVAFNPAALVWTVTGTPVGLPTLDIALSEPVVAPDGSVTVTPTVRDGSGVVQSNAGYQFTVAVAPVGTVLGNAPVVTGLSVKFPKLAKRLLNVNAAIDPAGEFADTDPTDPNFGRETGGKYRVTVSVVGTALSKSQDLVVLPSGTAGVTVKASQYAGQLGDALALAALASQSGDAVKLAQARAALTAVDANRDFSTTVLSATNSVAPPDGGALSPALLTARGLVAGPQDSAFNAALADLTTRIRTAKAQVDATNAAALTQASVDALQAAATAYKQSLQTLKTLQASSLGVVQQQAAINQLLATELPRLLDAIKRKTGELLGVTTTASADSAPRLAYAPGVGRGALDLSNSLTWLPMTTPAAVPFTLDAPLPTPAAMYAGTQPVQYFGFFTTMFGILTDLSGTARGNIIELSIQLANCLLNVQLADAINRNGGGGLSMDYCLASSSLAFVCPNYMPSRIGGSGFGRDASAVRVGLVGCLNSNLLRNLITLSVPSNLAARIRLGNKMISIVSALAANGPVAAVVVPDFIGEDDIGLATDMLYFGSGWPRVNQSRLPCVGVVIVMNAQTGGLAAVNLNFLGQCG